MQHLVDQNCLWPLETRVSSATTCFDPVTSSPAKLGWPVSSSIELGREGGINYELRITNYEFLVVLVVGGGIIF